MSKWIKEDKFKDFANKKASEAPDEDKNTDYNLKWRNPTMGTVEKAKNYRTRFLPDKSSDFYKKYFYHYFVIDEKHYFVMCPKTHGLDEYCPWCSVSQMLYKGNKEDKKLASNYSRKEKYVANVLIVDDPRDADVDDEYKVSGSVRLYEFPKAVESKLKKEITDKVEGYGIAIFNPENGYDMIISIKSKKKDKNGKAWPDYSETAFSRKSSSIGDEKEIDEIMEKTVLLSEHIENMALTWDEHKKLLKVEGFWEDVEEEFERRVNGAKVVKDKTPEKENAPEQKKRHIDADDQKTESKEPEPEKGVESDGELSDDDLLKDLMDM